LPIKIKHLPINDFYRRADQCTLFLFTSNLINDDDMELIIIRKYLLNCFMLLIPIFIWNIIFAKSLPKGYTMDFFWKDIPAIIGNTENILRIMVFILPIFMKFSLETKLQKVGISIYVLGIIIYFLSWIVQIYFPECYWSKSIFGFMAPAYTSIIWFVGIGLIGKTTFIKIPYLSVIYIFISVCFVVIHSIHTYVVFQRL